MLSLCLTIPAVYKFDKSFQYVAERQPSFMGCLNTWLLSKQNFCRVNLLL